MALTRTWYTHGNVPVSDFSTSALLAKSILWGIKAALKGTELLGGAFGPDGAPPVSSRWTVEGSSDSVTGAMDATDRWTSTFDGSKLVRSTSDGVAHSWIVLKSPAALGPYYILLDWVASSDQFLLVHASKSPFTGGSSTNRPTSTTTWTALNVAQFSENVALNFSIHFTVDVNGNFYFSTSKNTAGLFAFFFSGTRLMEARGGDTHDFFTAHDYSVSTRGAPRASNMPGVVNGRTYDNFAASTGGAMVPLIGGVTAFGGGAYSSNAVDSKFDVLPMYVFSTNATRTGIRGRIPDVFMCTNPTVGGSDPSSGTQERTVMGDFLIPMRVVPVL